MYTLKNLTHNKLSYIKLSQNSIYRWKSCSKLTFRIENVALTTYTKLNVLVHIKFSYKKLPQKIAVIENLIQNNFYRKFANKNLSFLQNRCQKPTFLIEKLYTSNLHIESGHKAVFQINESCPEIVFF